MLYVVFWVCFCHSAYIINYTVRAMLHAVVCSSLFSLLYNIPLCEYISLFIHLPVSGHFRYFWGFYFYYYVRSC